MCLHFYLVKTIFIYFLFLHETVNYLEVFCLISKYFKTFLISFLFISILIIFWLKNNSTLLQFLKLIETYFMALNIVHHKKALYTFEKNMHSADISRMFHQSQLSQFYWQCCLSLLYSLLMLCLILLFLSHFYCLFYPFSLHFWN